MAYEEAGLAAASAAQDVAFLAVDLTRGTTIGFTVPYVLIEETHVVPQGSKLDSIEAADRTGVHIGVAANSAYDLFLSRALRHAGLVRLANGADAWATFLAGGLLAAC